MSGGVDPRAEAVRGLSVCVGRRRGRVVIGSGSASSEGARGPRDVIQSACAKSIFLKAYCTLFAAAGWAARPCTSRGRSSIYTCAPSPWRRAEPPSSDWPRAEPRETRSTRRGIERLSTRSHKPVDAACESTARDKYNQQNHMLRDARRQLVISDIVRRAVRIPRPVTIVTSLRGAAQALLRLARRSKTSCTPAVSHACRNADDERVRCESDRIAFR